MPSVELVPHIVLRFLRDETGVSLIEYILVGSIIASLFILLLLALGKTSSQ